MKKLRTAFAGLFATAMIFGAASVASGFQYDLGDFLGAVTGADGTGGTEIVMEMGNIPFVDPATMKNIPVQKYSNLFDVNNVGGVFPGLTLADLAFFGSAGITTTGGPYRGYFTVRKDFSPVITDHGSIDSFSAATTDVGSLYSNGSQGGYATGSKSMEWGMRNGTHTDFLDVAQPGEGEYLGLEALATGGTYEMDIYLDGDDNYGDGQNWDGIWDHPLEKLNYVLRIGVDQTDLNLDGDFFDPGESMAYAETAPVPIPGAVWLFGSGILALMGIRRKNV